MCGIAGLLGLDVAPGPEPEDLVRQMIDLQSHRGPDGRGLFRDRQVVLGHCRLAIVGLGEAGRQPMTSRDGRWTIVFNGEVFNYPELREQLGGPFASSTDTEVLLAACAAWGVEGALGRVAGMFAFALWDARERVLTLARDRYGEKPLVHFWDGRTLGFASEMKALAPLHDATLDPVAVDAYLALGYVPAPLAIFQRCAKLPAGHLLRLAPGEAPRPVRWWCPPRASATVNDGAGRQEALREQVARAVGQRMRADVPIALCLSGGVDSSVIAAECRRQGHRPEAFTIAFAKQDPGALFASKVAEGLDLRHEVIEIPEIRIADELVPLAGLYDEPFADSSAVSSYVLARALAGRYKVVLNGDGGDETFGGYRHYEWIAAKQAIKAMAAAAGLCDGAGSGPAGVYLQSKVTFRAAERQQILAERAAGNVFAAERSALWLETTEENALRRALRTDRHLGLANGLTYKMDIALGAFGIEGRAPFLDHRLIEWTQGLADGDLVCGSEKKVLLRAAYARELPAEVLARPKQGFGAPIDRWLTGPLRELRQALLPCPLLAPGGQRGWSGQKLWTLLLFAAWARQWRAKW